MVGIAPRGPAAFSSGAPWPNCPPGSIEFERAQCWINQSLGYDIVQIASLMEIPVELVQQRIEEYASQRRMRSPEHQREITLGRIERYILALQPKVMEGDIRAISELRALESERVKILGLAAATKIDATVHTVTQEDLELQEILREAQAAQHSTAPQREVK